MGAYLSKPKTEVCSSSESSARMSYGASAMQGWRVSMEDAHSCLLDFDDSTSLFAVYDGHGGSEVAEYVSKHLPDVLKNEETYREGKAKQALTDTFLKVDQNIITEEGLQELKEIAGDNADDSGDENEADMLAQEACIPLSQLLAKLKEGKEEDIEEEDEEDEEDEEESEEEEKEEKINGDTEKGEESPEKNGVATVNGETEKNGAEQKHEDKEKTDEEEDEADDEEGEGEEGGNEEEEEEEEESDDEDDDDDDGEEGVMVKSDEVGYDSGTTAIVALIKGDALTVANVGDSRCVLCRNGIALEMSIDHKPEDEKELDRIQKAGGKVTCEGRVNGGLNLSRALGDHSYKCRSELGAHEQQITAMPDIRQTQLTEADEFMVIACDGIWNVKNSQEVVDFVRKEIKEQNKKGEVNLSSVCEKLFNACLAPDTSGDGSGCDNMTCVIVTFEDMMSSSTSSAGKRKADSESDDRTDKKSRTE